MATAGHPAGQLFQSWGRLPEPRWVTSGLEPGWQMGRQPGPWPKGMIATRWPSGVGGAGQGGALFLCKVIDVSAVPGPIDNSTLPVHS